LSTRMIVHIILVLGSFPFFQNTKNSFIFHLLVFDWSLVLCDTHFEVNKKIPKLFSLSLFSVYLTTRVVWSSFSNNLKIYKKYKNDFRKLKLSNKKSWKNYLTLISHFEWKYVVARSIIVGTQKKKCVYYFLISFLGKINILKTTSTLHLAKMTKSM